MADYKNFSPKELKELCCSICSKLDEEICQLEDSGSRICSNCPIPVGEEQKQKDHCARKTTKQIIKDYGSIEKAQEFISNLVEDTEVSEDEETKLMSTSDDSSSKSDGDDLKDDIGPPQSDMSEGTETEHVLDRRQLEEAKKLGIIPEEYEMLLKCQEWKAKYDRAQTNLQQAQEEMRLKEETYKSLLMLMQQLEEKNANHLKRIDELKEWLADHGLADMVTNETEE